MKNRLMKSAASLAVLAEAASGGASDAIRKAMTKLLCQVFGMFEIMAGAIASLVIVMAGSSWIKNSDNPKKRDEAKNTIKYVFMGIILILIAKYLVLAMLRGKGTICVGDEINIW